MKNLMKKRKEYARKRLKFIEKDTREEPKNFRAATEGELYAAE